MNTFNSGSFTPLTRSRRLALLAVAALLHAARALVAQPTRTPGDVASVMKLVIAATTDVHGRVRGWDYYANGADSLHGLTRVATIVDSLRAANPGRFLLVDAGDMLQGNPFAYVAAKVVRQPVHPSIAAMNAMRYDAVVVGNHEFDYGVPFLDSALQHARFAVLGANVRTTAGSVKNADGETGTFTSASVAASGVKSGGGAIEPEKVAVAHGGGSGSPAALLPTSNFAGSHSAPASVATPRFAAPHFASDTIVVREGVHIGIVGATTPGVNIWDGDKLQRASLQVTAIVPEVQRAVSAVRAKGADIVVVLLHSGLEGDLSYDTTSTGYGAENVSAEVARGVRGIDVIVFGHSHREVIDTTINGALLIQPKNWAATVGIATLSLTRDGTHWKVAAHRGSKVNVAGHVESPAILKTTQAAHDATVAWVRKPVGSIASTWHADSSRVKDTPIVDFILETMRREAHTDLASTASFSLDARLDSGAVTLSALSLLYPYDNTLRAIRISGKQLRDYLEYSSQYYRTLNADGSIPAAGIVDLNVCGYNFDIVAGAEYTIDLRKPVGARIASLSVRGKAVSPTDTFTMAVNNYRQSGGGGFTMLRSAPVTYSRETDLRQLLIAEVARKGTLRSADYFTENWHIEPASVVGEAYREQQRAQRGDVPCGAVAPAANGTVGSGAIAAQPAGKTLRILATSDFHAALAARPDDNGRLRGGAVALEDALDKARAECTLQCTSITVDGGDLFSGTPASDWDSGKPTVAVYNRLGISAGALGNHEFDFGQDTLRQRLAMLKYRVLAANVRGTDGKVPAWLGADTIVTRNGLRIGIVGAAAQGTPALTKKRNMKGLEFLAPAPIVGDRIRALRARNVDAVIVTIHDGARCTSGTSEGCSGSGLDFVRALTEKPDAVIMAHAHTDIVLDVNGIPTVQVSSNGRSVGVIDIPLANRPAAAVSIREVFSDQVKTPDAVTDTIVKNAINRVRARLEQPVATIAEAMTRRGEQYPLGNLMADAARVMANADFGAWNNGGIRANLPAGPLNYGGVHELSPFGNVLVKFGIRGRDIPALFESVVAGRSPNTHVSGMLITYDSTRASGSRIVSVTLSNGKPLEPNRVYTLAVNDFMLDDVSFLRPNLLLSTDVLPIVDNDAIAGYLRRLPQPVVPPSELRIKPTAAPRELH